MSFFDWYFGLSGDRIEQHVLCPFPHKVGHDEYYESNPSAQINIEKGVFHCKTCDKGFNEASFISAITGSTLANAHKILPAFRGNEDITAWNEYFNTQTLPNPLAQSFNISLEVQQQLKIVTRGENDIVFPVFMYNKLLDTRTYSPDTVPKCRSRIGGTNGLIIPFDLWHDTPHNKWTVLCAGEKDMAVARSHGFNAITITGGENMKPIMPAYFKNRLVAICYDNDDAGKSGAIKIADFLFKHGAIVKVVQTFHKGMELKEDITDYFNKYRKTRNDLIKCIEETPLHVPEHGCKTQLVTLHQATLPQNTGKVLRANVQVVAVTDTVFTMPTELVATKFMLSNSEKGDSMYVNEARTWALDEDTMADVLHLVDNGFKEKQLQENYKRLTKVPIVERCVRMVHHGRYTVYKAVVTDMFETASDSDHMPMEYTVYSINHRLESGKKYTATFKIVPHPYQGQQLTMILWDIEQASDSIADFKLGDNEKAHLEAFRSIVQQQGVKDAIQQFVNKSKGLIGYNGNNLLIETIDLAYHTPLEFHMGQFRNVRAYLDTIVVGESRMGKSSTADTLRKTYGLGTFVSLAGNSATIPGLVGGSNKVGNGYQTKAGLIPQNHKGLMIFEEFGKCKSDISSELTDIRSSNEVRITRVAGSLTLPAMVRMITLSNVKTLASKDIRSIASYPNGLAVIKELVGSAEDIARYDIMLVLSDRGNSISDPYWQADTPFTTDEYRTRIRWAWSRTPEQIEITEEIGHYIYQQANLLNKDYDTHIKVFGTEAWKKLTRIAIAVAAYTVSTTDYNNLVVLQEHVDYAVDYMRTLYDNPTFKLKEFVEHERQFSTTDENSVALLSQIYHQAPGAILHLEQEHKTTRTSLGAASGLDSTRLNTVTNQLIQGLFVRLTANDIIPTERFRLTVSLINRNAIRRTGETHGGASTVIDITTRHATSSGNVY
jgi:hypothetical protein